MYNSIHKRKSDRLELKQASKQKRNHIPVDVYAAVTSARFVYQSNF